jgi:hypothetical protein
MRYFFHVKHDAPTMLDWEGIELDDLGAVRNEATTLARESMSERIRDGLPPDDGRTFVVTDEEGRTVLTFPFTDPISD